MSEKMRAIKKIKPERGITVTEAEIPKIKDNEVLIKVKKRAICGTDLHIYQWNKWSENRLKLPVIIGHEFYGEIVEKGKEVKEYKTGELVTAEMHVVCNHCYLCRTGKAHLCENVKILGVDANGAFADFVAVPSINLWRVKKDIPEELFAIYDPFGNAVHTVFEGDIPTKTVLITGAGPIGAIAAGIAKAAGASLVIVSEPNEYRRELAKKLGADILVNPMEENLLEKVMELTDGEGVDNVLEMSGAAPALIDGLKAIRKGGTLVLLGIFNKDVSININELIIFKGIKIKGVNGRKMFDTWYKMDGLLRSGKLNLSPIITHRIPMEEIEKGLLLMEEGKAGKVILL
jgi:threonine 3-dehydrogenase